MRIDMERDRALLGLPPRGALVPKPVWLLLGVLLITGVSAALGLVAQRSRLLADEVQARKLVNSLMSETDPERIGKLAVQIRELAGNTAPGRRRAASVLESASCHLPQQRLWLSEAMNLFESVIVSHHGAEDDDAEASFYDTLMLSGIQLELGLERQALETLENVDEDEFATQDPGDQDSDPALRRQHDDYYNLKAYILSSASDPQVRDPQGAMQAIRRVIPEDADLADYPAAELDTLAECYYAAGHPEDAARVQRLALAGAKDWRLWTYLEHFRKYTAAEQ